jgi:hypothetical protein
MHGLNSKEAKTSNFCITEMQMIYSEMWYKNFTAVFFITPFTGLNFVSFTACRAPIFAKLGSAQ